MITLADGLQSAAAGSARIRYHVKFRTWRDRCRAVQPASAGSAFTVEGMIHESVSGRRNRRWTGGVFCARSRPLRSESRPGAGVELKDLRQKASYSYGYSLGRNLKAQNVDLDPELFARGFADALGGGAAALKDAEIQASLQAFAQQLQAKQAGMAGKLAATNKVEGERFLADEQGQARHHHLAQRFAISRFSNRGLVPSPRRPTPSPFIMKES